MKDFLEIALSGFWSFVGTWILLSAIIQCLFNCWNRWLRSRNIKHHGWPPPHCDADGDSST
jgi:hypothetical protein